VEPNTQGTDSTLTVSGPPTHD